MECGLQWKDITCWEDASRLTLTHEETLETAIADYCPDMGRVVETAGQLCLRSIVPQGDGVELRGTIQVTVLYTSEESVGLRSLTQSVPFTCWGESRPLAACQVLWAEGRQRVTSPLTSSLLPTSWQLPTCGYSRHSSRSSGAQSASSIISSVKENPFSDIAVSRSSSSCRQRFRIVGSSCTPQAMHRLTAR